ncbi:MAG TPA: RDD family protein [Blastocatellia bacterium]|nr:RDD family protein [Blastocatellia bacterium]
MLDDELIIETPERVELHYVLANVGNRFLACFIDHAIQMGIGLLLFLIALATSGIRVFDRMGVWTAALFVLGLFALYWGYFVIFETFWNGQTPGKRIMKLRVVREDGRPIRFFEVFVRNIMRLAIDFQPFPSYAIGVVSIIFSARSKRSGDFVAGTVVVKERATEAPSLAEIIKVAEFEQRRTEQAAGQLFAVDTRSLLDSEIRAIEAFLKRRFELEEPRRSLLASRILQPILTRLSLPMDGLSPEKILEEIEHHYRVQSRYVD